MKWVLPIRRLMNWMPLCALCAGALGQNLPVSAPTQALGPSSSRLPAERSQPAMVPAMVVLRGGLLTVTAQNSSLNQILGEISQQTGMKITGGIREERVFGSYGPATPQEVLASLLEGTGSNILMREDAAHRVRELLLTARAGGPTPPPPPGALSGTGADDEPIQPSDRWKRLQERREAFNTRMNLQGQQPVPEPGGEDQVQPSPNGVKTPNQLGRPGGFGPGSLPPVLPN